MDLKRLTPNAKKKKPREQSSEVTFETRVRNTKKKKKEIFRKKKFSSIIFETFSVVVIPCDVRHASIKIIRFPFECFEKEKNRRLRNWKKKNDFFAFCLFVVVKNHYPRLTHNYYFKHLCVCVCRYNA